MDILECIAKLFASSKTGSTEYCVEWTDPPMHNSTRSLIIGLRVIVTRFEKLQRIAFLLNGDVQYFIFP